MVLIVVTAARCHTERLCWRLAAQLCIDTSQKKIISSYLRFSMRKSKRRKDERAGMRHYRCSIKWNWKENTTNKRDAVSAWSTISILNSLIMYHRSLCDHGIRLCSVLCSGYPLSWKVLLLFVTSNFSAVRTGMRWPAVKMRFRSQFIASRVIAVR